MGSTCISKVVTEHDDNACEFFDLGHTSISNNTTKRRFSALTRISPRGLVCRLGSFPISSEDMSPKGLRVSVKANRKTYLKEVDYEKIDEMSPNELYDCSTEVMMNKALGNIGFCGRMFNSPSNSLKVDQLSVTQRSVSWSFSKGVSGVSYKELPMTEVISQKLYIGSEQNSLDEKELLSRGITHIISVTNHVHPIKGINHAHYPMDDRGKTELTDVLKELWPFMQKSQESGKKLFVHCKLGHNRSATLVLALLMKSKGLKLREAYKQLKVVRPVVQINQQYAKMLLKLENDLFGDTSLPNDWMEIRGFDSVRGEVIFKGELMGSMKRALS